MTVILQYLQNLIACRSKGGTVYEEEEEGCRGLHVSAQKKWISPLSQLTVSYVTSQDYFCLLSFLCYAFRISLFPLRVWGIQNEGYLYTGVAETLQFSISKTQLTKLGNIYSIC